MFVNILMCAPFNAWWHRMDVKRTTTTEMECSSYFVDDFYHENKKKKMFCVFMFVPVERANGWKLRFTIVVEHHPLSASQRMPYARLLGTYTSASGRHSLLFSSYSFLFVPLTSSAVVLLLPLLSSVLRCKSLSTRQKSYTRASIQISLHRNFEHDAVAVIVGGVLHIRWIIFSGLRGLFILM